MVASERRRKMLDMLSKRRFETILNLAHEFEVSERTIRRDISILSETEPIYTRSGRYGGGVYILENYNSSKQYFLKEESEALKAAIRYIENNPKAEFPKESIETLKKMHTKYTKPTKTYERNKK